MQMGELNATEIDGILRAQTVARLGCARAGEPYVVPINYAYDGAAIYVHSLEGAKVQTMRDNPRVCIEVDEIEAMDRWRTVVAQGSFEELHGDEARAALARLVTRLLPPEAAAAKRDPFAPPGLEDRVVLFRVRLTERHGRWAAP